MSTTPPPDKSSRGPGARHPLTGRPAHAWLAHRADDGPIDWTATIRSYYIDGASASPLWRWCLVGVVHLREIQGGRPPLVRLEGASHELIVLAIHRESAPDLVRGANVSVLSPPEVAVQVAGLDDEEAIALCDLAVDGILNGIAPPDHDYQAVWESIVRSTAAHVRGHSRGVPR